MNNSELIHLIKHFMRNEHKPLKRLLIPHFLKSLI